MRLQGATIGRDVNCDSGEFDNPEDIALNLQDATVNSVYLGGLFRAEGEVRLQGATIRGNLECETAKFLNAQATAPALNLAYAKTGSVDLKFVKAQGEVSLESATIGGNLECDESTFGNAMVVLSLKEAKVGSVHLRRIRAEGTVSLEFRHRRRVPGYAPIFGGTSALDGYSQPCGLVASLAS